MKRILKIIIYTFALIGFSFLCTYFAVRLGLTNESGMIDEQRASFLNPDDSIAIWQSPEWQTLQIAIRNDKTAIDNAAKTTDLDPRLLVAILVPEQLRLFNDNRELFKKVFAPLKILGNQSQFSWGIMGVKRDTAIEIESHLTDPASEYYLGKGFEHILDFQSADSDQERFERMTADKDHYYNYLYAALYLKQIMRQWQSAGFDISDRPDILATLYNIGFAHSKPNRDPHSGGADINIGTTTRSFGTLAAKFYYSDELRGDFP